MSVGKIKDFVLKTGNWSCYVERLEMYFVVNKVPADLKLPTLIFVIGEDAYDLLSTLASPIKPESLTYNRDVEILAAHLQPKPSVLAERYKFCQRRQNNECIAEYVSELKKLSKYCEFGSTLDENIRDQLVCGLKSEIIRQRLFSEEKLDYNRAVTLALSLEAAERDASVVHAGTTANAPAEEVHTLNVTGGCSRCGDRRHLEMNCFYKNFECSWCKEVGHLRRVCPRREYMGLNQWRRREAEHAGQYAARGGRGFGHGSNSAGRRGRVASARRGRTAECGRRGSAALHLMDEEKGDYDNSIRYLQDNKERDEFLEEQMYQMSLRDYKPA